MGRPTRDVDDGLVLLYLLGREEVDLLGITNTFGNSTLKEVEFYTKKLLKEVGREDIPRFSGEPFANQNAYVASTSAGLSRYEDEFTDYQAENNKAAEFLVEEVNKYPGKVVILAAGPMGNLYEASRRDPGFFSKVKEIVAMGGYVHDLVVGWKQCKELNMASNPKAAEAMLYASCPVTVMNGHVCLQAPFTYEDLEKADFWSEDRRRIVSDWLDYIHQTFGVECFFLWDLVPAVYITNPEIFDRNEIMIYANEESLKTGMLKPHVGPGKGTNINMPEKILDPKAFMDILFAAWRRESMINGEKR